MKNEIKVCLTCGEKISGRSDKRFCDSQCRNQYNNQQHHAANVYMRKVLRILQKNRKILALLNPNDKTTVQRSQMDSMGYNFQYLTEILITNAGKQYIFCFDQGYTIKDDGSIRLVRHLKTDSYGTH